MNWTEKMLEELAVMHKAKVQYKDMAVHFGCKKHQVERALRANGIIAKNKGRIVSKETREKLKAKNRFSENPNPITLTTRMMICTSHFEGDDMTEIGRIFGRTPEQVEKILAECKQSGYYKYINSVSVMAGVDRSVIQNSCRIMKGW